MGALLDACDLYRRVLILTLTDAIQVSFYLGIVDGCWLRGLTLITIVCGDVFAHVEGVDDDNDDLVGRSDSTRQR